MGVPSFIIFLKKYFQIISFWVNARLFSHLHHPHRQGLSPKSRRTILLLDIGMSLLWMLLVFATKT